MKEGLCETCTHTITSYVVERDSDGYSTSITWTFKLYDNVNYQRQNVVIDAEGNTEEHLVPTVVEDNLIRTSSTTYNIPTDQRTTATHEEPHVHDNEIAFQAAYRTWADAHRESEAGQAFWNTFGAAL